MTKGKRAAFRNDEELKMLLQAAWERLEKRAASVIQKGGEKNNVKRFFSFKSVSEEAGCSRGLIGHKNCSYPLVRAWLKAKVDAKSQGKSILPGIHLRLQEDVELLERKLQKRCDAYDALCNRLGMTWKSGFTLEKNRLKISESTLKSQINELRAHVKILKNQIVIFDTQYANVILRQRLANRGLRSDMRPIKPASKAERRASISIVVNQRE